MKDRDTAEGKFPFWHWVVTINTALIANQRWNSLIINHEYFFIKNYLSILSQNDFRYNSSYWTNNKTYAVDDGLEGLTEKQTKLASYWNTPLNKICFGMKVNGETKWIVIDHPADSLFNVIANGNFSKTTAGKTTWKSLIAGSSLQKNCNKEGFNVKCENGRVYAYVRIGIVANNQDACSSCDSYLGIGASLHSCGVTSTITSGNLAICSRSSNYSTDTYIPSFGYILVQ